MTTDNEYASPNGVQFAISVVKCGKWRCLQCGQEGVTAEYEEDGSDDAQLKAEECANEHSMVCPAGRGKNP